MTPLVPGGAAERPDAAHLLPDNTVLYLHLADTRETVAKFQETAIGRITQDPGMKPLVSKLYGSAIEAFKQAEEQIGASLDDLLSIPQGEMCLALIAPGARPPRRRFSGRCGRTPADRRKAAGTYRTGNRSRRARTSEKRRSVTRG